MIFPDFLHVIFGCAKILDNFYITYGIWFITLNYSHCSWASIHNCSLFYSFEVFFCVKFLVSVFAPTPVLSWHMRGGKCDKSHATGFQRDEHLALSPFIENLCSSRTAFKPFTSSNVIVIYGFPQNQGSGLVIRMDIFLYVISAQNGVDCLFFHIFSEFLVGMPNFWVKSIKTACIASRLVRIKKNKQGLIVCDCRTKHRKSTAMSIVANTLNQTKFLQGF